MRFICAWILLITSLPVLGQQKKSHPDFVPDEKTAIRIGEAVLIARFGEERVNAQRPFRVSDSFGKMWIVQGELPQLPQKGGGMAVWINKYSGCIVNVLERMK